MLAVELLYQAAMGIKSQRLLIIHAKPHVWLRDVCEASDSYTLLQKHKAYYDDIVDLGLKVSEKLVEQDLQHYDFILVIPSKNKALTLSHIALGMQALAIDGKIMLACANKHGAKSYEKALKQLAGESASVSKSKCRICSARKKETFNQGLAQQWINAASIQHVPTLGLYSQPGLFAWDKMDVGSQLLLKYLPELEGEGMDLCCGYGLLSVEILKKYHGITHCHLVDADYSALDCADKNVQPWADKVSLHWLDASQPERLPKVSDWVVCNPPFHTGQAQDIGLGQAIVAQGCRALKRGGHMYMVANRKLPYEQVLEKHLRSYSTLIEQDGFKVIRGIR